MYQAMNAKRFSLTIRRVSQFCMWSRAKSQINPLLGRVLALVLALALIAPVAVLASSLS